MESAPGRLPNLIVTTLAMVGAVCSSILVGTGIGYLVTVLWFSNTRSDGVAAFLIAAIASGLFTSVVAFVAVVCRHHAPSPTTMIIPAGLWLIAAILLTRGICNDSYVTAQNAVWILKSGDQRSYELNWLITGWLAILASLVAALCAGLSILRGRHFHSP